MNLRRETIVDSDSVTLTRDAAAIMTSVDDGIIDMLGWRPDQLIGLPSTRLIHPDDQPSAVAAWMDMITEPGSVRVWRGRYRTADDMWRWVEVINRNRLDDTDGLVWSSMRLVTVDQVGVEEDLRARKQLLSRLSDAVPVGLVQIDANRAITFTNDRLHAILGPSSAATIDGLLSGVMPDDRLLLNDALNAVFADEPVDDIELRVRTPLSRVCLLSLRALTDGDGTVNGAIGCLSDVTPQVSLRRELEIRASVDTLTSCLNRRATLELLAVTLRRHTACASGTAVVFIDLDRFKSVNDLYGHAAGDRVLVVAAQRLRAAVREFDQVGRIGGDEFLVVCPDVENATGAREIGIRLAEALDTSIDLGTGSVELRASIGVAFTTEPIDADSLVAQADSAMYTTKHAMYT
jgi:diguanylate cyclase (GGDEF)-like protein/PAS domain S-box-containing protein